MLMRTAWSEKPKPGQFFMLRMPENSPVLLARPISVHDWENGILSLLYQVVGRGTGAFSRLRPGDKIGLWGPLGNGFNFPDPGKIALVGGGIGIAPLYYLAKNIPAKATAFLGYRSEPFALENFGGFCESVKISSESGFGGHFKGFVTELLEREIGAFKAIYCCGPTPMMKAAAELCGKYGVPAFVSLENKMACGIGACLTCTCANSSGRHARTCLEGPVFRAEEVFFDA
jgi:dihydroorotate dehydrogenase electron transfer subunit